MTKLNKKNETKTAGSAVPTGGKDLRKLKPRIVKKSRRNSFALKFSRYEKCIKKCVEMRGLAAKKKAEEEMMWTLSKLIIIIEQLNILF